MEVTENAKKEKLVKGENGVRVNHASGMERGRKERVKGQNMKLSYQGQLFLTRGDIKRSLCGGCSDNDVLILAEPLSIFNP